MGTPTYTPPVGQDAATKFATAVARIWPTYRCTNESLQPIYRKIMRAPIDDVIACLFRYKGDHPDDTKPHWLSIFGMVSGKGTSQTTDELTLLIRQARIALREDAIHNHENWKANKWKPIDEWTDDEVFDNFVDANTQHNNKGTRAGERRLLYDYWRKRSEETGRPAPDWMLR